MKNVGKETEGGGVMDIVCGLRTWHSSSESGVPCELPASM